jgi:hypothetical protein
MSCDGCGRWWFDDVVVGGLGIPVPSRRDTELCECAEDLPQYRQHVINVPLAERGCACTKAQVERFALPVPSGPRRPGAGTAHNAEPVPRAEAVRDIAAHVADRDAFVLAVPPDALAGATDALRNVRGATCYLDCGLPGVIRVRGPHLAQTTALARSQPAGTAAAVFVVPKTLPGARLQELLRCPVDIAADGSQDLLMIQTRDCFDLPALLVDAIGKYDPGFAASMYASDVRLQS